MITIYICAGTGILLIFIGSLSGFTLYAQAAGLIRPAGRNSADTLWTLFLVGMGIGLILLIAATIAPKVFPELL